MQIRQNFSLIKKAQETLLSPHNFYHLCQQIKTLQGREKLYFVIAQRLNLFSNNSAISSENFLIFFDYLEHKIKNRTEKPFKAKFHLIKVLIKFKKGKIYTVKAQNKIERRRHLGLDKVGKISVEIVGEGMIGQVAKIKSEEGEDLAFKVFFDSALVWQHGPWAEIPVAIYLQAHHVTKNIPVFKLGSENWAVWEWIYPETTPDSRSGITYEDFALQQGLTALNYLNRNNYNPYQIRLDLGGIQKEYPGRRWHDFIRSIVFYQRKFHQEGFLFFKTYLTWKNFSYFSLRLIVLVFFQIINPKFLEKFKNQWTLLKASK